MLRKLLVPLAALALATGLTSTPAAAQATKALVYCPVTIDAAGCGAIVTALNGDPTLFPGGVDGGYDGSNGTVDLATADLGGYGVLVVPSLADGAGTAPYALLRDATIAARLKAAFVGRVAVWSGTPDVGSTNRSAKDELTRNLAKWARPDSAGTHGPGLVALQDNSDDPLARYGWLAGISALSMAGDTTFEVYSNVQVLTSTGRTILTSSSGLQIGYTNMASYGLVAGGASASADATGGRTARVVLVTAAGEPSDPGIATVTTDKEDYQPGDTITVSGAGWEPGEAVSLLFHEDVDPPVHPDKLLTTVADPDGHLFNHEYEVEETDVGVRFTLTATGQTSGKTAQATFTDGTMRITGATPLVFSPNQASSAGVKDNTSITVKNQGSGSVTNPSVRIRSGTLIGGTLVRTITISGTVASNDERTVAWDGKNDASAYVADGEYTIRGVNPPSSENDGNNDKVTVVVDNTNPSPSVNAVSGIVVATPFSITGTATDAPAVPGTGIDSVKVSVLRASDNAVLASGFATNTGTNFSTWSFGYTPAEATSQKVTAQAYDKAGNSGSVTGGTFAVGKAGQTIVFTSTAPTNAAIFGTYTVTATGGASGNPVTFSSLTTGICTSSGTNGATINFIGAGTCTVAADQAGNANYNPAPQVTQSFPVDKATQTITFDPVPAKTLGDPPFTVSATASSGLTPVTFSSTTPTRCTSTGTNGATITLLTAQGQCTVRASQAGDATYKPATADLSINVAKASQTISFSSTPPSPALVGATYTAVAQSTSGLIVTLGTSTPLVCTSSGTNGATITFVAAGSCTVTANQAGNGDYLAAPQATQVFPVTAQAPQTITFVWTPADPRYGGTSTVAATATSGLAVVFSSLTTNFCTVSGSTVSFGGVGLCTIAANQSGNPSWQAAPQVTQSVTVGKGIATILLSDLAPTYNGSPHAATATTSPSGLQTVGITYDASASAPIDAGQYAVVATLDNPNYEGTASGTLVIAQATQTISFAPLASKTFGDPDFGVTATASSGLAVSFAPSGKCSLSGSTVHITGAGNCTITASQAGNQNYFPAADVPRSFAIAKHSQTILFGPLAGRTFGDDPFTLSATGGGSGNPVTFASATSATCSVSGNQVSILHAGGCTITADQAGNDDYEAASQVSQGFQIAKAPQNITFAAPGNKTFGDDDFTVSASASSGLAVSFLASGKCTVAAGMVHITGAGSCSVTAQQPGNDDYEPATDVAHSFTIAKATPVVAVTGGTFTYNADQRPATGSVTGVHGADLGAPSFTYNGSATAPKNAGAYAVVGSFPGNDDYEPASGNGTITIEQAPLTVTAHDKSRTYGESNPAFTAMISGFVGGENLGNSGVTGSPGFTGPGYSAGLTTHVGDYVITPTKGSLAAGNYSFTTFVDGKLTINQAPLTVTANSKSKYYGDGVPALDGAVVGIKNSENIQGVYSAGSGGGITALTAVGSYPIVAGVTASPAALLENYKVTPVDGTLTIQRATPSFVNLSPATTVFGQATTTLTGTLRYVGVNPGGMTVYPGGNVTVTANGSSPSASLQANGGFSADFSTGGWATTPTGYTVAYSYGGTDPNFNSASGVGNLKVVYNSAVGHKFLQPVNLYPDPKSSFKLGSTVPVKFQIFLADGVTPYGGANAVIIVTKISNSTTESVNEEVVVTPADVGSSFRYDATGQQYIYNMGTKSLGAGSYTITADLNDGGPKVTASIELRSK